MRDDGKKENIIKRMCAGTPAETPADTPTDTPVDPPHLPPCRQAEVFIAACPLCHREMRVKTLMYTHRCKRSFDPAERALEQHTLAETQLKIRTALIKKQSERQVQHPTEHRQEKMTNNKITRI